ncbi:pentatricopeptide repeat-containing protein At4g17616 isoform X2 [Arachis duranensis]|uniref:Pentatricopeptide repeat-containing protein At4g17616 isoform X2 n=1 Tax=Arachis duranensis TaxID=130453 RepID=A0A9C6WUX9_ARADU|nr:pentatricopeptide repeat-containing protein At4g17616 isoform X2 [Arachis duranensis]
MKLATTMVCSFRFFGDSPTMEDSNLMSGGGSDEVAIGESCSRVCIKLIRYRHPGMVLPFTRYIPLHNCLVRKASTLQRFFPGHFNPILQKISTSSSSDCERLPWERSTQAILLGKLKTALRNHQMHEGWESFQDFRTLYGYPEVVEEENNSGLVHVDTLTKLALSLARLQMSTSAAVILRLMLDKGCVPPMHLLCLVFLHLVKTEIGAYIACNYLSQVCDFYICLKDKKAQSADVVKPDASIFCLVLDACVRFNLPLKGLLLIELVALTGTVVDAHTVVIVSQILEMNGLRDEIRELKDHIDSVSAAFIRLYRQFYDSLLSLHFKFNDIDAAAKLVFDMNSSHNRHDHKENRKDLKNPCSIAIGSRNLRTGLKIHIELELLQNDSVVKPEGRQDLIFYRGQKLVLSNRALAKFITGYKKDGRISELSKLLLSVQEELYSVAGSRLCSDAIGACIHFGWLESAHDILDDAEAAGSPLDWDTYMLLLSAYRRRRMQRVAKALLKQMTRVHLDNELADDTIHEHFHCVETSDSLGKSNLVVTLVQILKDEDQIFPLVYEFNSSIHFFCMARMMEDALKVYRRMVEMNIQPTIQTFAYLLRGYSSLGMYREITILWGEIKRFMKGCGFPANRDLYELLLINFLRGGYFERVMEVIGHMRDQNMYADKLMYKVEFLRLHKNLYKSLKASDARTEAQLKRLEHVQEFRKWVGIV